MFHIGDRVRCIVRHPDFNRFIDLGSMGTVCGVFDCVESRVPVDWDDDVEGHSCDGLARSSHGWHVSMSDIELVDDDSDYEFDDVAFKSLILGIE